MILRGVTNNLIFGQDKVSIFICREINLHIFTILFNI